MRKVAKIGEGRRNSLEQFTDNGHLLLDLLQKMFEELGKKMTAIVAKSLNAFKKEMVEGFTGMKEYIKEEVKEIKNL